MLEIGDLFKKETSFQTFPISGCSGLIELVCTDSLCIWNPYVRIFPLHTVARRPKVGFSIL